MDLKLNELFCTSRECKSLEDTCRLARAFVKALRGRRGALVLFDAPMGAGKTTFIREVVRGLDKHAVASSPTFSIINKYCENIFHVDLYRLGDALELYNTDFYEIISDENFVFVEWACKFEINYPSCAIRVKIEVMEDGTRVFYFTY